MAAANFNRDHSTLAGCHIAAPTRRRPDGCGASAVLMAASNGDVPKVVASRPTVTAPRVTRRPAAAANRATPLPAQRATRNAANGSPIQLFPFASTVQRTQPLIPPDTTAVQHCCSGAAAALVHCSGESIGALPLRHGVLP